MPALHIIDAARVMHEATRFYFTAQGAKHPTITATWSDLPQDQRDKETRLAQMIMDDRFERHEDIDNIRLAVVNALRPFLEE
jgi:hypothetical protein